MSIQLTRNKCSQQFRVPDNWAGRRAKCRGCGSVLCVPIPQGADLRTAAAGYAPRPVIPPPLARARAAPRKSAGRRDYAPWLFAIAILLMVALVVTIVVKAVSLVSLGFDRHVASTTPGPIHPVQFQPGVDIYQTTISDNRSISAMQIWLYLPEGAHAPRSLPCVLIAPAGTRLLYGSNLGLDDQPEHLPYAHAGFAVLAYELSGNAMPMARTFGDFKEPVTEFMAADGGLDNARAAIDWLLANVPEVDPQQLYAAGRSSAATMALNLAAADSRIRAVAA